MKKEKEFGWKFGRKIYWLTCEILFPFPPRKREEKKNSSSPRNVLKTLPEQHIGYFRSPAKRLGNENVLSVGKKS